MTAGESANIRVKEDAIAYLAAVAVESARGYPSSVAMRIHRAVAVAMEDVSPAAGQAAREQAALLIECEMHAIKLRSFLPKIKG